MRDVIKQFIKIGVTVASVAITKACGGDSGQGFAIGSVIGSAITSFDIIKEHKNGN